jgi:hypothetical protein
MPQRLANYEITYATFNMSWILLLTVQTSLVASGKLRWHRQLGILGLVIAPAMVVLGLLVATWSLAAHRYPPGFPPFVFFFGQITTVGFAFPLLVFFAFYHRKDPATHKRLIIIATLSIFDAAITRWPILAISQSQPITSLVVYSFLLLMVVYDLVSLQRIQKGTLWGSLFLIVYREVRTPSEALQRGRPSATGLGATELFPSDHS